TSMNNLALVLTDRGKYKMAEDIHRLVLKLTRKVLGPQHPSMLTGMDNLVLVLRDQGKYKAAEEMHRQVLELREKMLGPEGPSTLPNPDVNSPLIADETSLAEHSGVNSTTRPL